MQTRILSVKIDIAHFALVNGKHGHFNSLREIIGIIYDTVTWKLTEGESQCQKKCYSY